MKHLEWMIFIVIIAISACGGDEKGAANRAQEAQKAIQEGTQKEKQLYEAMQKNVENLEKKPQEKKEEAKK